jgi:hypothetical protein
MSGRRKAKLHERLSPCECCGYPLSHRHHTIPIAGWGESGYTIQLCPNCHELFHLILLAYGNGTPDHRLTRSRRAIVSYTTSAYHSAHPDVFRLLYDKAKESRDREIEFRDAFERGMKRVREAGNGK